MVTTPTSITAIIPCLFHRLHFFPLRFYGSKGSEYPLTRGADQKVTSSCDCSTPRDSRRSALLREEEKTGFSSSSLLQLGSPTGPPSRLCLEQQMAVSCRGGAPLPPPLATHLRDTDKILSISILRFSTSFTRPLSGPCLTFSRPIKYKHFGVRSKSRFTLCKDRCFRKVSEWQKSTQGTGEQVKGSCFRQ